MDVTMWEALTPAEHAKLEAEKKAEEEKRGAGQAAWQALSHPESQAIGSLAEGLCEGREGGGGRPCQSPECRRAQVPHLHLVVRGPGALFQ